MLEQLWRLPLFLSKLRCQTIKVLVVGFIAFPGFLRSTPAQELNRVVVPLQINYPYEQTMMMEWIEFDKTGSNSSLEKTKPDVVRYGTLPGGLRVVVENIAESPQAYKVKIDTDGDNDVADETPMVINLGASTKVEVTRRWENGKVATLPYALSYLRRTKEREIFHWRPAYVARGKLRIGKCEANVEVLDVNGDGLFDRRDFSNATTIHIDDGPAPGVPLDDPRVIKHKDGRIELPEELRRSIKRGWLKGEEIIEFCGGFYEVDRIEPDGSALILSKSDQRIPRIGDPLPAMVLTTLEGQAIDMQTLKGSVTLLDFWASWCRPCVEKFADVKRMVAGQRGAIKVIAINVDESERLPMAREVIKEYKLTWPHVARGLGEKDPLWKVFGSMSNNGLAIPLYVLVDAKGIIRYAGNGDEDLSELHAKVKELEMNK